MSEKEEKETVQSLIDKIFKIPKPLIIMGCIALLFIVVLISWPRKIHHDHINNLQAQDSTFIQGPPAGIYTIDITEQKNEDSFKKQTEINSTTHKALCFIKKNMKEYKNSRFIGNPIYDTLFLLLILFMTYRTLNNIVNKIGGKRESKRETKEYKEMKESFENMEGEKKKTADNLPWITI